MRAGSLFQKNSGTHTTLRRATWLSAKSKKSNNSTKPFPLTRESLAKLRQKARRKGAWFRDLKPTERRLLDLTIRVVQKVRSFMLAKIVSRLVQTLQKAMESHIVRLIRIEGPKMAKQISEIASAWGYRAAKKWSNDKGFMQYLVINNSGIQGN